MNVIDLGLIEYKKALDFQTEVLQKRIRGQIIDTLIIVEHYPVLTLGRIQKKEDIVSDIFFKEKNIPIILSNRGGAVTYHSPGQLVIYPIVDLREAKAMDISKYIDLLENITAAALNSLGVPTEPNGQRRGVWAFGKKIAFIGIGVRRWVTFHGLSVNINNDIEPFGYIHPCGERDIKVTSAKALLGRELDISVVKERFMEFFTKEAFSEVSKDAVAVA